MKNNKEEEQIFEEIEESLRKEEEKSQKRPMPVSGRSVFDIKRFKEEREHKKK